MGNVLVPHNIKLQRKCEELRFFIRKFVPAIQIVQVYEERHSVYDDRDNKRKSFTKHTMAGQT